MKTLSRIAGTMTCALALATAAQAATPLKADPVGPNGPFKHVVVIYQENHSFDNLYGGWGAVGGKEVNGRPNITPDKSTQLKESGKPYNCLYQNDVNLTSPPLPSSCKDNAVGLSYTSNFGNAPFRIDSVIPSSATTCPPPGVFATHGLANGTGITGGCTEDIVHRYYTEIYQIDKGKQDHYVTGSDASGLSMGYYDTTLLPIFSFLHANGAPNYVIADNFFQGAFGGSFLNHQWLIAAASPVFPSAVNDGSSQDLHSVVDNNGMAATTPLYANKLGSAAVDAQMTASCSPPAGRAKTPAGVTCGDFIVNTTQPFFQPYSPGTPDYKRAPLQTNLTIGDRLNEAGVTWAWYSGGWSNADGEKGKPGWTNGATKADGCTDPNVLPTAVWPNCPDKTFQFHHQPFAYFANYRPGTVARATHLRDEAEFIQRAQQGKLPQVSFVKPLGIDNEHPGYASETTGSSHLVDLINDVMNGPDGANTLIIVTYDEFGGQWDHVSPPGTPGGPAGPHDKWGPGTRIPALLVSKAFKFSSVDHIEHDTTSVMGTLEHLYGLAPVGTRDAQGHDLSGAINLGLSNGL
ncbi:MAG TPA: alkaline phosphatase family protein [Rhizomicrobium sp.]|jgi:phospholipase C